MPKKLILGLVGEIASGKDTVALYLKKKYRSETISFSQPLRDILDLLGQPQIRQNMADLGFDLRKRFGQDILSKAIAEQVKKSKKDIIVLPNVRLESDLTYLKKLPGFHLVHVDAAPKTRYARLTKRTQNPDDKTKTWAQFVKDAKLPTEIHIRDLAKKCEFKLDNNTSNRALNAQIETLMGKF